MNPVDIAQGINHALLETTIASNFALLLVLLMRRRVRAMFGAPVAYAAWLLVPIASIAVLLPAPAADIVSIPVVYRFIAQPMQAVVIGAEPSVHIAAWLCAAWLSGAITMLMHFIRQQRRFRISLGRLLLREADVLQADAVAGLPAVIGWMNPVIVLPADFDTRYSAEQRSLMLAHERSHIRHGDLQATAGFLLLRCLLWFNPFLHFAARAFRHDQELACDQRVIARHPTSRRAYGEAIFQSQLATQALPLGCHWGFTHPLKERIEMLKTSLPSRDRRTFGASLIGGSVLLVGAAAWAAQPTAQATAPMASAAEPVRGILTPAPVYPKDELAKGLNGTTVLLIDLAADGSVTSVFVDRSSQNKHLDDAAMEAVKRWTFTPAVKDDKAIASKIRVPVEFRNDGVLPQPPPPPPPPPPPSTSATPPPPPPPPPSRQRR